MAALRSGADRRKFRRTPFRSHAELFVPKHEPMKVRTVDLSSGGVGIVGSLNLPPGVVCEIHLHFRRVPYGMDDIVMQTRTAYCVLSGKEQGFLMGLQFIEPSPQAQSAVDRYIKSKPDLW
jgi:c-di-GMP-binding flagellar brake protein YcgR